MRTLYSLLIYLLTPLLLLYLALRGLRDRKYLQRWSERFARFEPPVQTGGIVVHAVSMGEVNAAAALVDGLKRQVPELPVCLTTFTPTGSERALTLFGDEVFHVYAPLDLPGTVVRFFERLRPCLLIIMETEIWPNLYHQASSRDVPILIANARISDRSIGAYRRFRKITAATLSRVSVIAAQSEQDAQRLVELGADKDCIAVTGNLKFDIRLPPGLTEQGESIRQGWGKDRLVLVAGSTHEGDEIPVFEAFKRILRRFPSALLVLVPRHPERFGRAAQLAKSAGLTVSLKSERAYCPPATQCYVIDAMGELTRYYAACDVAFVGGSLAAVGGHNVLEPAALSKPVLMGPHMFNFADISRQLLEHEAAIRVADAKELEQGVCRLFGQPDLRDHMGMSGLQLVEKGQGALARTLDITQKLLTRAVD
jgi:3-deoxy-D-manno-octulosonic-acid transferase